MDRYTQRAQVKAAERRKLLAEVDRLAVDIGRCEKTIASVMEDLNAVNAKFQNQRTTSQEIEFLKLLLDCAKRKLAWEKQIASLKKRSPALLESMTSVLNDREYPASAELKAEMLRLLQVIQGALERLQTPETAASDGIGNSVSVILIIVAFSASDSIMLRFLKSIYAWGVRICAVVTFGVGIYVTAHFVMPSLKRPMADFVVAGKSIGPGAYCIDFHEPNHPGENMQYYFVHHDSFYEEAQTGDHMQVAVSPGSNLWGDGYRQLVRNGRIVARSFSDEQTYGTLFVTALFLPALVFLPIKYKPVSYAIWGLAVTSETLVIGVGLFWALIIYAIGHSTGC